MHNIICFYIVSANCSVPMWFMIMVVRVQYFKNPSKYGYSHSIRSADLERQVQRIGWFILNNLVCSREYNCVTLLKKKNLKWKRLHTCGIIVLSTLIYRTLYISVYFRILIIKTGHYDLSCLLRKYFKNTAKGQPAPSHRRQVPYDNRVRIIVLEIGFHR